MGVYRSTQHDDDGQGYDWRDRLLALGMVLYAAARIGACSWRLILAVTP